MAVPKMRAIAAFSFAIKMTANRKRFVIRRAPGYNGSGESSLIQAL